MESFIKLFHFLTLERKDFGNEEDDLARIRSSLEYWKGIEPNLSQFWKDAYKISRRKNKGKSTLRNDFDKLYSHLKGFQNFNVNVSK